MGTVSSSSQKLDQQQLDHENAVKILLLTFSANSETHLFSCSDMIKPQISTFDTFLACSLDFDPA